MRKEDGRDKMNQRQKIKRLKKDNELMHRIINKTPEMKRLYDDYNMSPKNIITTPMKIQEYGIRRLLPRENPCDADIIALIRHEIAREIAELIEKEIEYQIDYEAMCPTISGRIFIGRQRR